MKKALLLLLAVIFTHSMYGQTFELSPTGYINADGSGKSYIVLEFPQKKQKELYDAVKAFIVTSYNSPKDVISEASPTNISIMGLSNFTYRMMGCDIKYKINLAFRDNQVKVDFLIVSLSPSQLGATWTISLVGGASLMDDHGIFKKSGEVRSEKAKKRLEDLANGIVYGLKDSVNASSGVDNEEW